VYTFFWATLYILALFRSLRRDASSARMRVPFMLLLLLLLLSVTWPPRNSKLHKEDRLMPLSFLSYMLTYVPLITRKWRPFMKRATDDVINAF